MAPVPPSGGRSTRSAATRKLSLVPLGEDRRVFFFCVKNSETGWKEMSEFDDLLDVDSFLDDDDDDDDDDDVMMMMT